jgi:hypothetical protein
VLIIDHVLQSVLLWFSICPCPDPQADTRGMKASTWNKASPWNVTNDVGLLPRGAGYDTIVPKPT